MNMNFDKLLFGACFFDSREAAWELLTSEDNRREFDLSDIAENTPSGLVSVEAEGGLHRAFCLEYDWLFRGTDADFLPPLWASMSHGDHTLCNQTTLEVIRFYHKYGYEAEKIEGNPADYIGEQLHFLTYLTAAACQGADTAEAAEEFVMLYTMDLMKDLCDAVEKRGCCSAIRKVLRMLLQELAGFESDCEVELSRTALEKKHSTEAQAMLWTAGKVTAIADEETHIIPTAGINNCGGKCVIRPTVAEGCILKIESDCSSNSPQIRACVRGRGYRRTYMAPERLRYPMKRVGERGSGKFEKITWDEAVELIRENWICIRKNYGPESRYVNYATGVTGILQPSGMISDLLKLDGGYLNFFNSYSSACIQYVSDYIYGSPFFGSSPQQLTKAKLIILWGNNEAETIIGSERNWYLMQAKELGAKIVVIDPRMSQTAVAYADEWYAVRPTTDSALADAMAYVLWSEGLQNQAFMDRYCLGFDEAHMPEGIPAGESFHSYLFGIKDGIAKTPEWAEKICGIPADRIYALARLLGSTHPASIIAGYGPQRNGNGEQTTRSICALAAMTGNIGVEGGNAGGIIMTKEHIPPRSIIAGGPNPCKAAIPSFLWTKAVEHGTELTPKEDRLKGVDRLPVNIKMIFNLAGNALVNQHSNINDTIRILKDESLLEFILCSDIFMTPSARFADLLLPGASVFETENITAPWRGNNYLLRNNQVIAPLFESRPEFEWILELADRMGVKNAFSKGYETIPEIMHDSYEALRALDGDLPDYETFCQKGGWQYSNPIEYIAFKEQIEDPEKHPFPTPSGKIEIFSRRLYEMEQPEDIPAIPKYVPCPEGAEDPLRERFPLQLIGWHTRRRCHSVHDNNEWMDEVEKPLLWMHPADAAERQIRNGEMVRVYNDRGIVEIPVKVTRRICERVVAMPQGAWYKPDKNGVDHRGSINVLTGTAHPTPLAKGNPQHTNLVEVCRAAK